MKDDKTFIGGVLKRKTLIIIMMLLCFVTGSICYIVIPKQHFPKVVVPVGIVKVIYPGASAEEIEEQVVGKVEHTVMEMNGYDKSETTIVDNGFIIKAVLNMNLSQKEVDDSFDKLRKRLDLLDLPAGVTSVSVDDDIMEISEAVYAMTGENISHDELSQRCEEAADILREVDGVRKVKLFGDLKSEVHITVDSAKLNAQPVSMAEIAAIVHGVRVVLPFPPVSKRISAGLESLV